MVQVIQENVYPIIRTGTPEWYENSPPGALVCAVTGRKPSRYLDLALANELTGPLILDGDWLVGMVEAHSEKVDQLKAALREKERAAQDLRDKVKDLEAALALVTKHASMPEPGEDVVPPEVVAEHASINLLKALVRHVSVEYLRELLDATTKPSHRDIILGALP